MRKSLFIKMLFGITVLAILVVALWCILGPMAIHTAIQNVEKESTTKFNDQVRVRFLDELSAEINRPNLIIDQEIQKRSSKRIMKQRGKYNDSSLPNYRDLIIDQIKFLVSIKDEFNRNKYIKIVNLISQEIISLRILLEAQLGNGSDAAYNFSPDAVFSLFYVPANLGALLQGGPFDEVPEMDQMGVLETIWPNGCRSISYTVNEAFPVEKFILELSGFYTSADFVPLDFDLCMPRSLGGLKGGWRKAKGGDYWVQFWENNNDIINVNITASENQNSIITIIFIKHTQAAPILDGAKKRLSDGPSFFQPLVWE